MRIRLIHVTTRRSGSQARREELLDVASLRVGRDTDNDLPLAGLTVSLHHASFERRADGIYVRSDEAPEIQVNGRSVAGERKLGGEDVVQIGAYSLRRVPAREGEDLALEVEQSERPGAAPAPTSAAHLPWNLSARKLSWALTLGILAACLALPLLSGRQAWWSSGRISNAHAFIAEDCKACHGAFERVESPSCLACHAEIGRHASEKVQLAGLDGARCADCHAEHEGREGLASRDKGVCAGCHADLSSRLQTELGAASDFGREHPEFRLQLLEPLGPGSARAHPTPWSRELSERSGVRFSHFRHVGQSVTGPDRSSGRLRCDACHRLDVAGQYMQAISFARDCQKCHRLDFDPDAGEEALHGDPARMRRRLRDLYSGIALRGQSRSLPQALQLRIPGQPLTQPQAAVANAWVDEQVRAADALLFDEKKGECARCHEILPAPAEDGGRDVAPVAIAPVWVPRSEFRHATHAPFACRDCHAAAAVFDLDDEEPRPDWSLPGARPHALASPEELAGALGLQPSKSARDVLIPGIDTCRRCHGGASAAPPRVSSECVLCHPFHRPERGPMRGPGPPRPVHAAVFSLPIYSHGGIDSRPGTGSNGG